MAKVKVKKAFDAYVDGEKITYPVGDADIPSKTIEECALVAKGLISKPSAAKKE